VLLESALEAMKNNNSTKMSAETLSLDTLISAAEANDSLAKKLLKEFGDLLGIVCINLVNTLNMELLVISGMLVRHSNILIKYVTDKVHKDLLSAPAQAVKIVSDDLKERGGVIGAAGLVLEDLFYKDSLNVVKYRNILK